MVTHESRTKLTYEDYAKTPDDERWELIDGELVRAPSPNIPHQSIQSLLGCYVQTFVRDGDLGRVFFSPTDVVLSEHTTVEPDLVFVSKERERIITYANIQGAPVLVVEILSPSTARRDWRDKFDLYQGHGVNECWLVDPVSRTVWVFLLADGVFVEMGRYGEDDTLTSPTLEGLEIVLAEVFGA